MWRMPLMVTLLYSVMPVCSAAGQSSEAPVDKEWLVSILQHYESRLKNYSVSYRNTFTYEDPRWVRFMAALPMTSRDDSKKIQYHSFEFTWEWGKWRSAEHIITRGGDKTYSHVVTNDLSRKMIFNPKEGGGTPGTPVGLVTPVDGKLPTDLGPNTFLLVGMNGERLSSIVRDPNTRVYRSKYNDRDVIVCECSNRVFRGESCKVYMDPDNAFTVVKQEFGKMQEPFYLAHENIKYAQCADDVMFPVSADCVTYAIDPNGLVYKAQVLSMTIEERTLKVNTQLPNDVFRIKFPEGTAVQDLIVGRKYMVGAHSDSDKVIEDIRKNGIVAETPVGSSDANMNVDVPASTRKQDTSGGSSTWARNAIIAVVGVAVLALAYIGYRRLP